MPSDGTLSLIHWHGSDCPRQIDVQDGESDWLRVCKLPEAQTVLVRNAGDQNTAITKESASKRCGIKHLT